MKCVMIINESLPLGLIANTAAVLGVSIGAHLDQIVGEDVVDGSGELHRGITRLSIPLLRGTADTISQIRNKTIDLHNPDLYLVDFCDAAQKSKQYSEYCMRMAQTPGDELSYLGIGLFGPDKQINALTGNLGLLR